LSTLKINKKLIRTDREIGEGGSADLAEFVGEKWQWSTDEGFLPALKVLWGKEL
jgi:hypothetical protein